MRFRGRRDRTPRNPFALRRDRDGVLRACRLDDRLTVEVDPSEGKASLMHRVSVRLSLSGGPTKRRSWLRAELDGVRLFVTDDNRVILTKRERYP